MKNKIKNNTVYNLRKNGHKVRIIHYRRYVNSNGGEMFLTKRESKELRETYGFDHEIATHGGTTIAEITTPDGINATGFARCNKSDQFNRRISLNIALGRALKNIREGVVV